jgi:dihydropteroate synthase
MRRKFAIELRDGKKIEMGDRTVVIGVLNVTPDSFSDGGQTFEASRAIDRALEMENEGADIIEVGGESTRPGASRVSVEEELARILPVVSALANRLRVPISIDTYKSQIAASAVAAGARIINDVSALRFDPALADVAAREQAALVLMHMRGEPATMQKVEPSEDIFAEINSDLDASIRLAETRGVNRNLIIIDPGIGFGKTLEQNLAILNHLQRFEGFNLPLMLQSQLRSCEGLTWRECMT